MNLNNRINKTTAIIGSVVLLILFTLTFLILPKTAVVLAAYIIGIFASIMFCLGNLYFIGAKSGYPWIAAIPMTLWRYIITSTLLSAVAVIAENIMGNRNIPLVLLIVGQIIILAFFFIMLTLMYTGKNYIEEVDKKIVSKRQFIKDLGIDLVPIKESAPNEVKKDIQAVIDAVRYSDPMSDDSLSALEDDIKENVMRLRQQGDPAMIQTLCTKLIAQIKERNNRAKALK